MRVCVALAVCVSTAVTAPGSPSSTRADATRARLPLSFVPNRGQTAAEVAFTAHGRGFGLFLMPAETVLVLPGSETRERRVLRIRLAGASGSATTTGLDPQGGRASYFLGRDPRRWRTDIPTFGRVRADGVYPGIDVVHYARGGALEFDFVVAPGADPARIQMDVDGADTLDVDAVGDAVARMGGAEVRLLRPVMYQEQNGRREEVPGRYVLSPGGRLGFRVGDYDLHRPLVIDPVLAYSTLLGGGGDESGQGIALDERGAAYVTGVTSSLDFPTEDPAQPDYGGGAGDAFVAKLDKKGRLVYATYLGGGDADQGNAIAVDRHGKAHVTGQTDSRDFPTARAFQETFAGTRDAFVAKLGASGSTLLYSTYLGGAGVDSALGIALDERRKAYVVGGTSSEDFPLADPMQPVYGGGRSDAFVTKLSSSGALVRSTFLGGNNLDVARAVAVTAKGNAHVVGDTFSPDFPTSPPLPPPTDGMPDAFVTKLDRAGALAYSVPLRGSLADLGFGVAVDERGSAYVTGGTASADFPTLRPLQPAFGGAVDAFVTRLDRAGGLAFSTFLGGAASDIGQEVALDRRGNAYVTGGTSSANFPTVSPLQAVFAGNGDAFVAKLKAYGSALAYSTYLGGSGGDAGLGLDVSCTGDAVVTGSTDSADFPLESPQQGQRAGPTDAFVARIAFPAQDQLGMLIVHVEDLVAAGALDPERGEALERRLRAAQKALSRGRIETAVEELEDFVRKVRRYVAAGALPPEQGHTLTEDAREIMAILECE